MEAKPFTFLEFFAGGGMARLGLDSPWECCFANDWCEKKAAAYRGSFGGSDLKVCGIADLTPADLPGRPTLVWASFPCQDLSLAGNGAGLAGARSGTFRPFWKLMRGMIGVDRAPRIIVLENVTGALSSHDGSDFKAIAGALAREHYQVGALVMDAVKFLPQSRPRLFVIGVREGIAVPSRLVSWMPLEPWHTKTLRSAVERLPRRLQESWTWWNVPAPSEPVPGLTSLIEDQPTGIDWHTSEETRHIIGLMAPRHLAKLAEAQRLKTRTVGTVYRRIRRNPEGVKMQRAEIRFDQISGCLRTPAGGSSRQTIVIVEGRRIRSRLLSPREAARLMGVPDTYPLPANYNEAYHLFGDGVAVPVVRWLSRHLLIPLAEAARVTKAA